MKFEIEFTWKNLESGPGESYRFPDISTPHMKRYRIPAVYRWVVLNHDGSLEATYIGEAENVERRLKHYLKPGDSQYTNLRIKATLEEYQSQGKDIRFQLVTFENFVINACNFGNDRLSDPFVRAVVENLVVLEAFQTGCKVLNKGTDVARKKVESILKTVTSTFTASQKDALVTKLMDATKRAQ